MKHFTLVHHTRTDRKHVPETTLREIIRYGIQMAAEREDYWHRNNKPTAANAIRSMIDEAKEIVAWIDQPADPRDWD